MKIRNGFVSNSSSSSFMLIGKMVDEEDITNSDIKDKNYVVIGKSLGDGDDIFYIETVEMLWFIKTVQKMNLEFDFGVFNVYETFKSKKENDDENGKEELKFNSKDLPDGELIASSWYMDYKSSKTVEDLFDKYLYYFEEIGVDGQYRRKFNIIYKKFQRQEKLKKIKFNEN